ncbi:hypothetical protein EVG20_g9003 [Dentipellis fragilis]|uniref:Uncharacterized protein n=1 Tax=Dentipellis fragilis TaxID=205917 RepID=A0A4Y9Y388_9AGAM|nr:hypothetical protein EVG20_g9003 [Dentipellis fragilis]
MQETLHSKIQHTPPEVWLSIFKQATFVPHAFDTDASDPFHVLGTPITFDPSTQVILQSALATKWSLVLVCKSWNDLATPLLYQAVAVRSDRGLQSLRDTLTKRTQRISPTGSFTSALRVQRLDLFRWSPSPNTTTDILIDVFQHLPDLEIFCASTRFHDSREIQSCVQAFIANCAASMRKCVLSPLSEVSQSEYEHLISRCPQLSHLFIPWPHWENSSTFPTFPDSLTFLSIDRPLQTQSRPFPSLQHVYVQLLPEFSDIDKMETVFIIQGPYLRTVEFHMSSADAWTDLSLYFDFCTRYCPNLVHLILIMDDWEYDSDEVPSLSIPATVTHLGLYMGWEMVPLDLEAHLSAVRDLLKFQDTVPGVIRRLHALTEHDRKELWENLELRTRFAPLAARCRLEDADGNELFSLDKISA